MGFATGTPRVERLESRRLLAAAIVSPGVNVNVSRSAGDQSEGAIAIDPADPRRVFVLSNLEGGNPSGMAMQAIGPGIESEYHDDDHAAGDQVGLFAGVSSDGGATWATRVVATDADGLPASCCDPSAAFDRFGNLFVAYLNANADGVVVLLSTDAGMSFRALATFSGNVDQPTVAVGDGAVWVLFSQGGVEVLRGAAVTGQGAVGAFGKAQSPAAPNSSFGDLAVGPAGQVLVAWQNGGISEGPSQVSTSIDLDGQGAGGFTAPVNVVQTNVGIFDNIPPQNDRSVDAEVGVAFDRSGGAYNGRAYLVYTDEFPNESGDTDVMLRYSNDGGMTWGAPVRVNDDAGTASQFLPKLAVDRTTGAVAVAWYDTRNDSNGGNDDAQLWCAVGVPTEGGVDFLPNFQVSAGSSNATRSHNSIQFGDYIGLAFDGGNVMPVWADNSNSTGDNPQPDAFDLYTDRVVVQADLTPAAPGGGPSAAFKGNALVRKGASYQFQVTYADAAGVDASSVDGGDVLVTGPNDYSQMGVVRGVKKAKKGAVYTVKYRVLAPAGKWNAADNGAYMVSLEGGQVRNLLGNFADSVEGLGAFTVNSKAAPPAILSGLKDTAGVFSRTAVGAGAAGGRWWAEEREGIFV